VVAEHHQEHRGGGTSGPRPSTEWQRSTQPPAEPAGSDHENGQDTQAHDCQAEPSGRVRHQLVRHPRGALNQHRHRSANGQQRDDSLERPAKAGKLLAPADDSSVPVLNRG
jgi:hypothetical protein